jgi:predicted AlkP superfamily pyrophosphatase or phosphodiesterase
MLELDLLYARFLEAGFNVMRTALNSKDWDWIEVEYDVLHNAPSLIGESNIERHRYFWFGERTYYIERITALGREEARSRMLAYYKTIWDKMEPLITEMIAQGAASNDK